MTLLFKNAAIQAARDQLLILDQTKLPLEESWEECLSIDHMVDIIKALKVRGAPLIGVTASLAFGIFSLSFKDEREAKIAIEKLIHARPTAVNLAQLLNDHLQLLNAGFYPEGHIALAIQHANNDVLLCENIAAYGANLLNDKKRILTHCNTGELATAGRGTALGVISKLFEKNKDIFVYVDETRPLLQGARLTAWELSKKNIPYYLICDNMAADLMRKGNVDAVIVGADRICRNGDFANKIGTYSLAVLAHYHHIPFYVAAPWTTVDLKCATGDDIVIEERNADEVRGIAIANQKVQVSPKEAQVYNPAFDVTPETLVTNYILDTGILAACDFL